MEGTSAVPWGAGLRAATRSNPRWLAVARRVLTHDEAEEYALILVTPYAAQVLIAVHDALGEQNKRRMEAMSLRNALAMAFSLRARLKRMAGRRAAA